MRYTWSRKAKEKLVWEAVTEKEVAECILKGAKIKGKGEVISKYRYLTVVFKKRKDRCHIISLWTGEKEYKAVR